MAAFPIYILICSRLLLLQLLSSDLYFKKNIFKNACILKKSVLFCALLTLPDVPVLPKTIVLFLQSSNLNWTASLELMCCISLIWKYIIRHIISF